MNREKVIEGVRCHWKMLCTKCPYHEEPTEEKEEYCGRTELFKDVLTLLDERALDYEAWSKEIGVNTCATCKHRDRDCPIESTYVIPLDGYCHLWEGLSNASP